MTIKLLGFRALSPIHAGTGSGDGAIDLPIIREVSTGVPIIPGSTIKGVFRSEALPALSNAFGDVNLAGSFNFSDAYVLLLPVRSLAGVFAWVTSPYLLKRYLSDLRIAGVPNVATVADIQAVTPNNHTTAMCAVEAIIKIPGVTPNTQRVIIEDVSLSSVQSPPNLTTIISSLATVGVVNQQELKHRLCIVSDTVMSFLLKTATEIRGRNRIDELTGIVADQALWYEEMLPIETILSGIVRIVPRNRQVQDLVAELQRQMNQVMMFGGKSTVGRGLCDVRIV